MSQQRLHRGDNLSAIQPLPSQPSWLIKRVFRLTLRTAQGFIDSIFALMDVPLRCPDYTSVSKRAKSVNVSFKRPPGVKFRIW
ncbi:transposase [Klebsiella pneumoniae]